MNIYNNLDWQNRFTSVDNKDSNFLRESLSLLCEVMPELLDNPNRLKCELTRLMSQIDKQISLQLDLIIHHSDFELLHSNWLGLEGLIQLPINKQRTKLKLLNMNWQEVSSDLNLAYSTKASTLYNKVGNKELNTLGGEPFGCLLFTHKISLDMGIESDFDDLFTLELLADFGKHTLCPVLLSPDDGFFLYNKADWLSDVERIEKIMRGDDYLSWQTLRQNPSSKFIGMVMPSVKMRSAYKNAKVGFLYNESGGGLWGNAAFAFTSTIMREHHRINWFGFLKSRWNDKAQGAIVNVENHPSQYLSRPETNVVLFGQLSNFYAQIGFIPLTKSVLSDRFYFNGNYSIWSGENIDNDRVIAQLQTTLMCCRIAHYLKVQVREILGSFTSAKECERFLTTWIEKFSSNVSQANEETLSKYPLSFANISVRQSEHDLDVLSCTLRITPQYQYDHLNSEIVLTTELEDRKA